MTDEAQLQRVKQAVRAAWDAHGDVPFPLYDSEAEAIARAALSAACPEGQWQPIETAPTDGTQIDLWAKCVETGEHGRVPNCSWDLMADWDGREFEGWRGLYIGLHRHYEEPTHWRPLPASPSSTPSPAGEGAAGEEKLPPSLAAKSNIPYEKQTVEQLEAERAYWQAKIDSATGWGSWLAFADDCIRACDVWLEKRRSERNGTGRAAPAAGEG